MNEQENKRNYEGNQMLSQKEYEQYFEKCEEVIKNIKTQAIEAMEKRDRKIAKLEEELNVERNTTNQQIKEIKSKIDKIEKLDKSIEELRESVENKNNSELGLLRSRLEEKKAELEQEKKDHLKLKTDFEENEKRYNKAKGDWEEEKKDLNKRIEFYEQIESEKNSIEADLKKLKEEIHYGLYERYCALPDDFKNKFTYIVPANIFAFLQTSGGDRILSELHTFICEAIQVNKPETEDLKSFFDLLFKASQTYESSLKRLETKTGDNYDNREMMSIRGNLNQRKVVNVLFLGYRKENMVKESLVEVE